MSSLFSELSDDLIIENDRKKYGEVVEQINMVTTYEKFCPSIREMMNYADDDDPESMSVSQIWLGPEWWRRSAQAPTVRVMEDLGWLNKLWNEEKKRK